MKMMSVVLEVVAVMAMLALLAGTTLSANDRAEEMMREGVWTQENSPYRMELGSGNFRSPVPVCRCFQMFMYSYGVRWNGSVSSSSSPISRRAGSTSCPISSRQRMVSSWLMVPSLVQMDRMPGRITDSTSRS